MSITWIAPTDFVSGDPTLRMNYPSVAHPSTVVTCTQPGDSKWIYLALRLPQNVHIEDVTVCYRCSEAQSFISQVRLLAMDTPDQALAFSRDTHADLMRRMREMSDADLRRTYNHYQPNDPRDPHDDRPVVDWVAGNTYDHYTEHVGWINQLIESSAAR